MLIGNFQRLTFSDIYREQNDVANALSKDGCIKRPGEIHYSEICNDSLLKVGKINIL